MTRGSIRQTQEPQPDESLYDRDFGQWIEQQVELLRSGRTTALDMPNLVEEPEGLTKSANGRWAHSSSRSWRTC
jgi:hypothetical protein